MKDHWEKIYSEKTPDQMSWTQAEAGRSLEIIHSLDLFSNGPIMDVGGGRSPLTRSLWEEGYRKLSVLDISGSAIAHAKEAFGSDASQVEWYEMNVLDFVPKHAYDLWHDRAVFHFLTHPEDVLRYKAICLQSVIIGGYVLLATFASDGPEKCSGLPVTRYDENRLRQLFEPEFEAVSFETEQHTTPFNTKQSFIYGLFQKHE